jgi:hypothetical protein
MEVTPYVAEDRSAAPIASYPVAKVRDAIKDLHTTVMTSSRTEFPKVEDLQDHDVFKALKKAAKPDHHLVLGAPVPDADRSLEDAISLADLGQGVRPGSVGAAPADVSVFPQEGASWGGTLVTVTGSGFFGTPTVRFGTAEATEVTVTSTTSLTCRAPAGTEGSTVHVTVRTPAGTSPVPASGAADFTYRSPKPVVTSLEPSYSVDLTGVPVRIHGQNLGHATAVRFDRIEYLADPGFPNDHLPPLRGDDITDIEWISDTEIRVTGPTVPAIPDDHSGHSRTPGYHVIVHNVAGDSDTDLHTLFSYSHVIVK